MASHNYSFYPSLRVPQGLQALPETWGERVPKVTPEGMAFLEKMGMLEDKSVS